MEASTQETRHGLIGTEVQEMIASMSHPDTVAIDIDQPLVKSGITSIELIDLVTRLERRYGILFQPTIMKNLTAKSLIELVEQLVHERHL
jgi:acyl carrier protein